MMIFDSMALPTDRPLTIADLIAEAAQTDPDTMLAQLTPAQMAGLGRAALADELKDAVRLRIRIARVDLTKARQDWLAGYTSRATRDTYGRALARLQAWAQLTGTELAGMTPAQADDWLRYEIGSGQDADTVRLRCAAVSSFFRHLERAYPDAVRNPIKGTRTRPRKTTPAAVIPTPREIRTLLAAARLRGDKTLYRAILILSETGLRIGGLAGLTVHPDGKYDTTSKAHKVRSLDPLTPATVRAVGTGRPFAGLSTGALKERIRGLCTALHRGGRIAAVYSPHDLRHSFAERHKGKGLYWLKGRLGHASVSITETYLRNTLGINPQEYEGK
jgi:integrase